MKFQVGDRVKIKNNCKAFPRFAGKLGVVTDVWSGKSHGRVQYPYEVELDGIGKIPMLYANELERVD